MKISNARRAIIHPDKLVRYLLNPDHERGGSKAALLQSFGYTINNWQDLENDLRQYHLTSEVAVIRETPYGIRYEILAPLLTPKGRWLTIRSIWQIDIGADRPRFITLHPD